MVMMGHCWRSWCSLVRPSIWASRQCSCYECTAWRNDCCMRLRDYHPDVSDAVWGRGLKKVCCGLGMVSFSLVPNLLALSVTPLMRWLLCSSVLAFGSLSRPQLYPWRPAVSPVNSPPLPDSPHRPSDANLEIGGKPEIYTQTEAEMDTNGDRWISRHAHARGMCPGGGDMLPKQNRRKLALAKSPYFCWIWYFCCAWQ